MRTKRQQEPELRLLHVRLDDEGKLEILSGLTFNSTLFVTSQGDTSLQAIEAFLRAHPKARLVFYHDGKFTVESEW